MLELLTIAVIIVGMVCTPFLFLWGVWCLMRQSRRAEGTMIVGFGLLAPLCVLLISVLLSHRVSPGLFRIQALINLAGFFGLGAIVGKVIHLAFHRLWPART
jgi:hypothetical protein